MSAVAELPPGYEIKPQDYFEQNRQEMLAFIPSDCARLLDVGCGKGAFASLVKQSRKIEVWGVEPVKAAAMEAETKLDRVLTGCFGPEMELPENHFDCVVFNDVLEHLLDPAAALVFARKLLRKNGVVVSSIPNIRHFQTMWDLMINGEWTYADWGILDRTHLKFFTRKSIAPLFAESGFTVERLEGIRPFWSGSTADNWRWKYFKLLNLFTFGRVEDMKYLQFGVRARANKS